MKYKQIKFTPKQLAPVPGGWQLRINVDGKQIKRKLTDPKLTSKNKALKAAREIVREAREGKSNLLEANKSRRGVATVGEILAAYISSPDFDHVPPKRRRRNALELRIVLREGLSFLGHRVKQPTRITEAGKVKFIYHEDQLSSDIFTYELGQGFKKWRLENAVPRTGSSDPRRECDEPVAGKLEGRDQQRMLRSANSVLSAARCVFTAAALDPDHGPYNNLNLPDLSGFLKVKYFSTNNAEQYVPPSDELVNKIIGTIPKLKAGTLENYTPEHKPVGLLRTKPGHPFLIAKWRINEKQFRTQSTGTVDRAKAQAIADKLAAASNYIHHDKRVLGKGFYVYDVPGYDRVRRGKQIHQQRCAVAMILALELGLRAEEIAEARWSQFTRAQGRWIFTAGSTESYKGTKGKVDRSIPVSDEQYEELRSMLEDSVFVISGTRHYRRRILSREVAGVMRSCGWRRPECLHELRKIYASDYGRQTKDAKMVQEVLGHKSLKTTMRYLAVNELPTKAISRRVTLAA